MTGEQTKKSKAKFIGENGEEIVWCHLLVLRLRSEYFNGLLRMEPETKSISLYEYSSEVVKAVVKSAIAVDEEELKKVDVSGKVRIFLYFMIIFQFLLQK